VRGWWLLLAAALAAACSERRAPRAQVAGPALFGPLGVQPRDLRLLDWKHAAMYPSALLCRERALLAALEHLKCLITREAVLVMATDQPAVLGFLAELQRRLKLPAGGGAGGGGGGGGGGGAALAHVREEMPFELHALEVVLDVVRAAPRPASHAGCPT
jgi:hypothetical protein